MKIKKVPLSHSSRYHWSAYEGLLKQIRKMPINTAIEVTLDVPNVALSTALGQIFRRGRENFSLATRKKDGNGSIWYIAKMPLNQKRKIK